RAFVQDRIAHLKLRIKEGGLQGCAIRGLIYAGSARGGVDERGANALRRMRLSEGKPSLTLAEFKGAAPEQCYRRLLATQAALGVMPSLLPGGRSQGRKAFDAIREILAGSEELKGQAGERLLRVQRLFGLEIGGAAIASGPAHAEPSKKTARAKGAPVAGQS